MHYLEVIEGEREIGREGEREMREREGVGYLPEIKSNGSKVFVLVEVLVGLKFRIGDLWVHPLSLVGGIVYLWRLPGT